MPSSGRGGTYLNTLRSGSWSGWQRIDNYGTSSLSELASALGAINTVLTNSNLNDVLRFGIYGISGTSNQNTPMGSENQNGFIIVNGWSANTRVMQLYVTQSGRIYLRVYTGYWSNWQTII